MIIWYLILGIGFGIILQKSRICFVTAVSDPQITGSTEVFRALLIGILTSSLGITIIKYLSNGTLDMLGVSTISLPLMLGAFLFGTGMILAGACASGMFIRLAEGYLIHLLTIPAVILGYLFANSHYQTLWAPFVINAPALFLPAELGWTIGVGANILLILMVYLVALRHEQSNSSSTSSKYLWGAISLGLLNIIHYLILDSAWSVTGAFYWFGELPSLIHADNDILQTALGPNLRNLGIFLGAFLSVLLTKSFRVQKTRSRKQILKTLLGGFLMGYGACIAGGCTVSAFFVAAASLSLSAWVFLVFLFAGSFVGIKLLYKFM